LSLSGGGGSGAIEGLTNSEEREHQPNQIPNTLTFPPQQLLLPVCKQSISYFAVYFSALIVAQIIYTKERAAARGEMMQVSCQ